MLSRDVSLLIVIKLPVGIEIFVEPLGKGEIESIRVSFEVVKLIEVDVKPLRETCCLLELGGLIGISGERLVDDGFSVQELE